VILFGLAWEILARSRLFAPALTPTVSAIGAALGRMVLDGSLFGHVAFTLYRVLCGLILASAVGVPLGMLMGRWRPVERFFLPLMSVLMPIPSLAWVPVFILWFGLGNTATIMLVFYAATFPLMYNAWTGARSVNRLWLRVASAMGADERALFWKVTLPGSLPFVIAGLRQAFARSWIAVVGGEMIAASSWGLGWVVFDAKEFLSTDVMMGVLVVIGALGLVFERVVFQALEARSVARWGMLRAVKA
jgi:NitT/TauT family transport system permease protein